MENLKNDVERICSFYVSDWHLVTMILPYINKELNEKADITTILENDIENNIKTLIGKLNLKNEEKILNIDWKQAHGKKYLSIAKRLQKLNEKKVNTILVNGNCEYIDTVNKNIEKYIEKNKEKLSGIKLKIINCYEVTEFNGNIRDILDKHEKILNTAGEKYIYEVFDGYEETKEIC